MSLTIVPPVTSPQNPATGRAGVLNFRSPVDAKPPVDLLRFTSGEFPRRQEPLRLVKAQPSGTEQGTRFFCVHIPHFPAWVALQANPMLRSVPFVVQAAGEVVAASPMARRCGIEAGQTVNTATKKCASLRQLDRNLRQEIVAWQEIQREVSNLTTRVESVNFGHLVADVSQVSLDQLTGLVSEWRVPGGVAPDRATAHLACLAGSPGEVRSVEAGAEREFLRTLPVTVLAACGVSSQTLARMAWFGWNHLEALRALSFQQLREQFGDSAPLLWRFSRGARLEENIRPVAELALPDAITARRNFQPLLPAYSECEDALTTLFRRALSKTGDRQAQTVELVVTTAMGEFKARRVLREPVARWGQGALLKLEPVGRSLLKQALGGNLALTPPVYALEIRLGGFVDESPEKMTAPVKDSHNNRTLAA